MNTHKQLIFAEIEAERIKQDEERGGAEHDDKHDSFEWREYIEKQLSRVDVFTDLQDLGNRERYIKIAALAVAAIESIDRKAEKK